ncbi:retrograde regulation protein 2, partial [Aureobasidium melanogenum]
MATPRSTDSSRDLESELKRDKEAVPTVASSLENGAASSNSSFISGDKTFLRVPGEDTYVPIDKYEGRHRWDPQFQWDPIEEKQLVRKIDLRICTWVCLTFFALQLDRANIVQALTDNMLDDLHINTNDYNYGQTIFYLCFLAAELPSQLISKKLGPDRWIPIQMVSWSLVASFQAFLNGRSSFYACRALLGLIEGGFIPDNILYLSYWYTGKELPARLAWFWTSYQATSIVGAFLAAAILTMRGVNGMAGWRWLFALEGTLAGLIGVATYFYMPPSPCQTASRFRGKNGWFTERQEKIMVNRILRDDPSKGDMHNRQAVTPKLLWYALCDWEMWPIYLIGLSFLIPNQPITQYLSLILKQSFGRFEVNMLTIPSYVLFIINLLFFTWLSEKVGQRFLMGLVSQFWVLPLLIVSEFLSPDASRWVKYTLATLLVGAPYVHAIHVAITSRNAGSVRTRTVASALYNMFVQASSIIGSNIFRNDDKPLYRRGYKVLIIICAYNILLFIFAKFFYVWRNKVRDRKWNSMTPEEQRTYLATTTDRGNKLLTFRFAH